MSGFDGMFRSQVFAADQRMRGTQALGEGLVGGSQALARGVIEGRQLAMQEAESQAKVRMVETERALTAQKLQALQAIDMTEQGRLQVEQSREAVLGARLQREAAQHAFDRQRERDQRIGTDDEVLGETLKRWGDLLRDPEAMYEHGLVFKDGRVRPGTPEELAEQNKKLTEGAERRRRGLNPQLERNRMGQEIARLQAIYDAAPRSQKPQIKEMLDRAMQEYAAAFGELPAADAGAGAGTPPPPEAPAAKKPNTVSPPPLIVSNVFNDPAWKQAPELAAFNVDAETRYQMSRGLAAVAAQLVQLRQSQGRDLDPAQAHKLALEAARTTPAVYGFAMKSGGFADDEIRRRLRATFPAMADKKALDTVMRYVNDGGQ